MNYFFGLKYRDFKTEITVPRFQNKSKTKLIYNLYEMKIISNKWVLEKLNDCELNDDFYLVKNDRVTNSNIFFLATQDEVKKFDNNKIINFNNFTDTWPEYRANLKIYIQGGGFSSYQSDYPYIMTTKQGNILSSISSIFREETDKNYLILRNIYFKPIEEIFFLYFVDIKNKKIIDRLDVKTNYSNFIPINKLLIKPEIYIMTDNFLGIPLFLSEHNKHLSIEHTHPPHTYVMSDDKYKIISEIKKEVYEIIG